MEEKSEPIGPGRCEPSFGAIDSGPALSVRDAAIAAATSGSCEVAATDDGCLEHPEWENLWRWAPPIPRPWHRPLAAVVWCGRVLASVISLLALLTLFASTPGLNLLALGYLLDAQREVARSGRPRRALPLLPVAGRLGAIACGAALFLVPLWLLADAAADARLIAPSGASAWLWGGALLCCAILVATHILCALACGGRFMRFLRPIDNVRRVAKAWRARDFLASADRDLASCVASIRPLHLLRLGVSGFFGAWLWLALPTMLFFARHGPAHELANWVGAALLIPALCWVPLIQVRLAAEGRWQAMLEIGSARGLFRRIPLSSLLTLVLLYSLAIPLFFYTAHLKLHAPWITAWWDLSLISLVCTLPARWLLARAYHRAIRREEAGMVASPFLVWGCRGVLVVALGAYLWLLRLTPMTHDLAPWRLVHHILVLPVL